jgi:hypothetical protein
MLPRHFAVATGLLLFAGRLVYAQVDAQDRTQSFFDDHKGADVINPDRVITNTVRRPPTAVQASALPPLTKVSEPKLSKANAKETAKLRSQKEAFVQQELTRKAGREQGVAGTKSATHDVRKLTGQLEKRWDDSPDGRRLKRLERSATTGSTLPPLTH